MALPGFRTILVLAFAFVGISVISGCVRDYDRFNGFNLPPSPMATASDSDRIRKLDAKFMEVQRRSMASHNASFESRMLLWKGLECMRRVDIAKARAMELISVRKGISWNDAVKEIEADPRWVIAMQGCRR